MRWKIVAGIIALSLLSGCAVKGGASQADQARGPLRFIQELFNPPKEPLPPKTPKAPSPPMVDQLEDRIANSKGEIKDGACWIIGVTASTNDLLPPSNHRIIRWTAKHVPNEQYGSVPPDSAEATLMEIAQLVRNARFDSKEEVEGLDKSCTV